jgi:hypothetical protein
MVSFNRLNSDDWRADIGVTYFDHYFQDMIIADVSIYLFISPYTSYGIFKIVQLKHAVIWLTKLVPIPRTSSLLSEPDRDDNSRLVFPMCPLSLRKNWKVSTQRSVPVLLDDAYFMISVSTTTVPEDLTILRAPSCL